MYVCMYVCIMYVCMYICMYVCVYLSSFLCFFDCLSLCLIVRSFLCFSRSLIYSLHKPAAVSADDVISCAARSREHNRKSYSEVGSIQINRCSE